MSVIVPTRGRPGQLATCVGALSGLRYPASRLEVVIADDGGDAPPSLLDPLRSEGIGGRIIRASGSGAAAARNLGATVGGGELLAFTDDDCRPRPDWLTSLVHAASRDPEAALGGRVVNALGRNPYSVASQVTHDSAYRFHNAGPGGPTFLATNNLAVPAEGFWRVGGLDPSFRTSEDRDFCARWREGGGRLAYVDDAVVEHAHELDLRSFIGQHLGYGRGAHRFHSRRRAAGGHGFRPSARFYRLLLERVLADTDGSARPLVLALAASGQLASALGFVLEALRAAR